jgi:hypothetical protein
MWLSKPVPGLLVKLREPLDQAAPLAGLLSSEILLVDGF